VPESKSPGGEETPFEQFRKLTATVMSVPKSKIDEREIKYRAARKNKKKMRPKDGEALNVEIELRNVEKANLVPEI